MCSSFCKSLATIHSNTDSHKHRTCSLLLPLSVLYCSTIIYQKSCFIILCFWISERKLRIYNVQLPSVPHWARVTCDIRYCSSVLQQQLSYLLQQHVARSHPVTSINHTTGWTDRSHPWQAVYGARKFVTLFTAGRHLSLSWARLIRFITSSCPITILPL